MDGSSSSVPLSPTSPPAAAAPPPPKVQFFRSPPPSIPIFTARGPAPHAATKPPIHPPPAPAPSPSPAPAPAAETNQQPSTPLPQPPPPAALTTDQPPLPPLPAAAMRPPRPPKTPSSAPAMRPSPAAPPAVASGQQSATPPSKDENIGKEICRAEVKEETVQEHDKASTPAAVKVIKRGKNVKASKQTMDASASNGGTIEGDVGPLYSSNHCRYDSSLSLLTKKFVSLLQEAEDGTIDLNKAARVLEVQKRRIYDITNVLEGVDLIEKSIKNIVRWKGFDMSKPKENERQISTLKEELESLYKEDERLENDIREMQEKLEALVLDEDKRKFMYVLKDDINNIPHFKDSTLIAINAPRGTCIEVPDPDADLYKYGDMGSEEKHYQMIMRSTMGPIDCYLISDGKEMFNPDHRGDNSEHAMATGSAEASQQMDCDPNEAVQQMDPKNKGDIIRIVPSSDDAGADYWFATEPSVSLTDTWDA